MAVKRPLEYSLAHSERLVRRITASEMLQALARRPLTNEHLNDAVTFLARITKVTATDALYGMLGDQIGRTLGPETLQDIAWRIAGNITSVRAGRPVLPWASPGRVELCLAQITHIEPAKHRDAAGAMVTARLYSGSAVQRLVTRFWSDKLFAFQASRFGFSAPWGEKRFHRPGEFVNLRMLVQLDPALSRSGPMYSKTTCYGSPLNHNKKVIKQRARDGFVCPKKYAHACYACPIGYRECPAGTHELTWVKRHCANCNVTGWFNPTDNENSRCLGCRWKRR